MIKPWKTISSELIGDFRVFQLRSELKQSPRTGKDFNFYVIDSVNWVNVVPVTPDNQLVMVEQYRHGSKTVELEIPGGMMDPEDTSPILAGLRELREETGYEGDGAEVIGQVWPNPAIMSNVCYTVLAKNCQLKHAIELDHSEDVVTRLVPVSEIENLVHSQKIKHCIVVAALFHFLLWNSKQRG